MKLLFFIIIAILTTLVPTGQAQAVTVLTRPAAVTSVNITTGDNWTAVSAVLPASADGMMVRWSTSAYPQDETEGTQGYSGTETTCNFTVTADTNIYITVFPYATSGGLTSYNRIPTNARALKNTPGWGKISLVSYNSSDEDTDNSYLALGTVDAQTLLDSAGYTVSINSSSNVSIEDNSINLIVDSDSANLSAYNNQSFQIYSTFDRVEITGKTAWAARAGLYDFLERVGFRFFFKHEAWTVVPDNIGSYDNLNLIEEPDYVFRNVPMAGTVGSSDMGTWGVRNKSVGPNYYHVAHTYNSILTTNGETYNESTYNTHPDWFYPTGGYQSYPWQLNPTDDNVTDFAEYYVNNFFATYPYYSNYVYGVSGNLSTEGVGVSPNDGHGWNPPYNLTDNQTEITNDVYTLADAAADNLTSGDYPNKKVTLYSYSYYSMVPTAEGLSSSILPFVATDYNYSSETMVDRIKGFVDLNMDVGIRDYTEVWQWGDADKTAYDEDLLDEIALWYNLGATYYLTEINDGWCGQTGLNQYLSAKKLWDTSTSISEILEDFYEKAFGDAASTMQDYYEHRGTSDTAMGYIWRDLNTAMTEASGDDDVLDRIRQLICHAEWLWYYHNIGLDECTQEQLEDLYVLVTKVRDWYVLTYAQSSSQGAEPDVRAALKAYYPGTYPNDSAVYALQDFTVPTDEEVAAILSAGYAEWSSEAEESVSQFINPFNLDLEALGSSETAADPIKMAYQGTIIIPQTEIVTANVTVQVKGECGALDWYYPSGEKLQTEVVDSESYTTINFTTYGAGYYYLDLQRGSGVDDVWVKVPNRAASQIAARNYIAGTAQPYTACFFHDTNTAYFYVPVGTDNFTMIVGVLNAGRPASGTVWNPSDDGYEFEYSTSSQHTFHDPEPGLWKITITVSTDADWFCFKNIPPLIWHDPEYLLVEAD